MTETVEAAPANKGKRTPVPEGWGTPIEFNHALTEYLRNRGVLGENDEHKPQVVYSYINADTKNDPFPVSWVTGDGEVVPRRTDGSRPLLRKEEGEFAEAFAWWERKEWRKQKRAANAANKAAKKSSRSKTETSTNSVSDTEDEFGPVDEVED